MCKAPTQSMSKHNKINVIHFSKNFLTSLLKDEKSCIEIVKHKKHLALHPYQLNDFKKSVNDILSENIAKYCKDLQGITLGYQNVTLLSNLGMLNYDSCFIHLDIEAEFFVFKPIVGNEISAIVNKKSKDHVGCLVHNTFNVSVPKPEKSNDWYGHAVQLGQTVAVKITFTNFEGRLPYIRGEFLLHLSEDSGINTESEESQEVKPSKKKLKFGIELENSAHSTAHESKLELDITQDNENGKEKKSKKKKKKDKRSHEVNEASEETFDKLLVGNESEDQKYIQKEDDQELVITTHIQEEIPEEKPKKKKKKHAQHLEESLEEQKIHKSKNKKHHVEVEVEEKVHIKEEIQEDRPKKKKKHLKSLEQNEQINIKEEAQEDKPKKRKKHISEPEITNAEVQEQPKQIKKHTPAEEIGLEDIIEEKPKKKKRHAQNVECYEENLISEEHIKQEIVEEKHKKKHIKELVQHVKKEYLPDKEVGCEEPSEPKIKHKKRKRTESENNSQEVESKKEVKKLKVLNDDDLDNVVDECSPIKKKKNKHSKDKNESNSDFSFSDLKAIKKEKL